MENFIKTISVSLCLIAGLQGKAQGGLFDDNKTYHQTDTLVRLIELDSETGRYRVGHFTNSWYTTGATRPLFYPNNGPWKQVGSTLLLDEYPDLKAISGDPERLSYTEAGIYTAGTMITFNNGCYQSKWSTSASPAMDTQVWDQVTCPVMQTETLPALDAVDTASSGTISEPTDAGFSQQIEVTQSNHTDLSHGLTITACNLTDVSVWAPQQTYTADVVVTHHQGKLYRAKWWTQDEPPLVPPVDDWTTAWASLTDCSELVQEDETSDDNTVTDPSNAGEDDTTASAKPVITDPPTVLPDDGYAFLKLLNDADWDWLFPLRSGKFVEKTPCQENQFLNCGGAARNDGSGDNFTLTAFIQAVLAYNHWAALNGYKQFLNEGTVRQQAQEFMVFWAKSSRETSGSWQTASAPWIVSHDIGEETIWAWKGGLYWVEEVGYSTDATTGKSPVISYVDTASSLYPPAPERSYYGRGIIQLSWNYNYGAFSYWLYDNGLFPDIIDSRDKLLKFPNLVADHGALSIMSGIWFWMTAQGAKPSSHDVIYGNISHISETTQQQGLPQSHSMNNAAIPTEQGDTYDQGVFAYRLGTVINIVNGGLECNKAAAYHQGPVQRVYYYDAYAAYLNAQYGLDAIRIDDARASTKEVWNTAVNAMSPRNLQSATCYNQRSYYGW